MASNDIFQNNKVDMGNQESVEALQVIPSSSFLLRIRLPLIFPLSCTNAQSALPEF
jgi:hypothetical protein